MDNEKKERERQTTSWLGQLGVRGAIYLDRDVRQASRWVYLFVFVFSGERDIGGSNLIAELALPVNMQVESPSRALDICILNLSKRKALIINIWRKIMQK